MTLAGEAFLKDMMMLQHYQSQATVAMNEKLEDPTFKEKFD